MYTHGWISDLPKYKIICIKYNFAAVKANGKTSRETENILTMPLDVKKFENVM